MAKERRKLEPGMRVEWEDYDGTRITGIVHNEQPPKVVIRRGLNAIAGTVIHRRQVTKVFVKKKAPKLGREWWIVRCANQEPRVHKHKYFATNDWDATAKESGLLTELIHVREVLDET